MSKRACNYCFDAGVVKCLYRKSVQRDFPVCEDEMAMQDLLDFDLTTGSDYIGGYPWKDLHVAPEDHRIRVLYRCNGWVYNKNVEICSMVSSY
jgi:hypothetical protein